MSNLSSHLAAFTSTRETITTDLKAKGEELCVPIHEGCTTLAIHVYRDFSGSPFTILEQCSVNPSKGIWFEFEWHQGSNGIRKTIGEAESALFYEYVAREEAA